MKTTIKSFLTVALVAACAIAFTSTAEARKGRTASRDAGLTIVGTALAVNQQTGEFSTLIAAVGAAGIGSVLDGKRQFTVFAPTDAAFAKLGLYSTNIVDVPKAALTDILLYHVATGSRLAADVVTAEQIRMLNGDFNPITVNTNGAFIGESKIVATDVKCSNGVIHVIDSVLLPPAE
jgi:transforming growth factor-beta-induced protein